MHPKYICLFLNAMVTIVVLIALDNLAIEHVAVYGWGIRGLVFGLIGIQAVIMLMSVYRGAKADGSSQY